MNPSLIQYLALILFGLSILHTFSVQYFRHLKFLSEIELIFCFWAAILLLCLAGLEGYHPVITYLESRSFAEPIFVFAILAICSTKPILEYAELSITYIAKLLPLHRSIAFYICIITLGPLLGSFITEPAAMTVTALILLKYFYQQNISEKFKYTTLGLLFVNVSIGGALTAYAAPPVLMVAKTWGWSSLELCTLFGWKGALACLISSLIVTWKHRQELLKINIQPKLQTQKTPFWLTLIYLFFLTVTINYSHNYLLIFWLLIFLAIFSNIVHVKLKFKESFFVFFFLVGLVIIGGLQDWWLQIIVNRLSNLSLFLGAIGLTAFIDNAALTYLGSLVPSLPDASKYALLSGAIVGGGMTVIANAPNLAGYAILQSAFQERTIRPLGLLKSSLLPTLIAALCFWFL
ncbi:MAG: putative Na+/H+ antiporter [Myxococcaceae bacterium]